MLLFLVVNLSAQKKDKTIGSEVVNVVKPYAPTLSDVFKIKEIPKLDDAENSKKIAVKYTIFSFPVASTFSPSKGVASEVEKTEIPVFYKNHLSIGLGSYNSANVDFFVNHTISENQIVGAMLRHNSAQNGIRNIELKNQFSDSGLDLAYENKQEFYSFKTNIGFENNVYNWYGLPKDFGANLLPTDRETLINSINPTHNFNGIYAGANVLFKENILKEISLDWNRFCDNYGSSENRFIMKPSFEIVISDKNIKTNLNVDYVAGSFKNNFFNY